MNWITHDKVQRLLSASSLRDRQREKMAKKRRQQVDPPIPEDADRFKSIEERTKFVAEQLFKNSEAQSGTPVKRRIIAEKDSTKDKKREAEANSADVEKGGNNVINDEPGMKRARKCKIEMG
uniref:Uncharacterized protein n=1 Tax=Steinernema glaseri TaxID=37863 RepID=A0A1I7Z2B1_9BILA